MSRASYDTCLILSNTVSYGPKEVVRLAVRFRHRKGIKIIIIHEKIILSMLQCIMHQINGKVLIWWIVWPLENAYKIKLLSIADSLRTFLLLSQFRGHTRSVDNDRKFNRYFTKSAIYLGPALDLKLENCEKIARSVF